VFGFLAYLFLHRLSSSGDSTRLALQRAVFDSVATGLDGMGDGCAPQTRRWSSLGWDWLFLDTNDC
jgi:hypothetical protein